MIKRRVNTDTSLIDPKPFHEVFPYGLSWISNGIKENTKHFAYFPYDDYRTNYIQRYKNDGGTKFKKFKTKPRD
jgi:hypothetical protein